MTDSSLYRLAEHWYGLLIRAASYLQSPLLLAMRLYWGWQFFTGGKPKLTEPAKFVELFAGWNIPFPRLNVFLAGSTETIGGLLLLLGLGSRLISLPLAFTMLVAYATAEHEALAAIFSDADKFTSATPFLFLLTALLILAFGPGAFSLDHLLARKLHRTPDPRRGDF